MQLLIICLHLLKLAAIKGEYEDGTECVVDSTDKGEFAALAFKIMTDPFVGQLAFIRVYRGILESGTYAYNTTKGKKERVGRLLKMPFKQKRRD